MNYILNIVKSKALVLAVFTTVIISCSVVSAFAYSRNNIYSLADFDTQFPVLSWLVGEKAYVLDVMPNLNSYSPTVEVSYDSLADLVYRCNQRGMNVTIYRNGMWRFAYVNDSTMFGRKVQGCLGNSSGSVYLAYAEDTTENIIVTYTYWCFETLSSIQSAVGRIEYYVSYMESNLKGCFQRLCDIDEAVASIKPFVEAIQRDVNESAVSLGTIQNKVLSMNGALFSDDGNSVAYLLDHIKIWTVYINTSVNTINKNLSSVVSDGKLVVDNSAIVNRIDMYFSGQMSGIYYWVSSINHSAASIEGDTIAIRNSLASLDTSLTSVISDGTLKVDNASVVTAIQSLESALSNLNVTATMDDTNIIKAVNTVDATLDTRLLQVYNSAERLRTTVSEGNTIQRGILNVVSTSDATLSDISEKLDKQNEYYTALSDYWGDLTTAVETQQLFLDRFDSEIFTIRQLLEKPLTVKTDLTSVTSRLDTVAGNVSDTIVVLSDISEKLDAQNEYYAALGDYWGDLSTAVSAQQIYLSNFETEIIKIRQLLEKPLVAKTDLTPVITSVDAVGLNIEDLNANFNTNIGSLLDKLDIVIEGTSESVENRINVTIDASNDAHNVFYVTGEDGEEQSVTEFTGDLTKASGRLLSLLYRLVFADTLSGVDGDLDGFEDFFTSQGDDTATQSMESPSEEENVWLAS